MPVYEYRCEKCGHEFEEIQRITAAAIRKCPKCGKLSVERLISRTSFVLKGSGWYTTDYGRKSSPGPSSPAKSSSDTSASDKPSSDKSSSDTSSSDKPSSDKPSSDKSSSDKSSGSNGGAKPSGGSTVPDQGKSESKSATAGTHAA